MTYTIEQIRQLNLHGPQTVWELCDEVSDARSRLADARVKLAKIKKLWVEIENEFPDGLVFEVKDRTKFVNACAQLRYLLGDI